MNPGRTAIDHNCLQALFDHASLCVHTVGADGRLIAMNAAGLALVGADSQDALRGRCYLDFVSPDDWGRVRCLMAEAFAGQTCEIEFAAAGLPTGRRFASCYIPCSDALGKIERLVGITRDISPYWYAARELRRQTRTHDVLARSNRSLARALDERALLDAFCTNLVEVGGYGFAWVGYAGRNGGAWVRLAAQAGNTDGGFACAVLASANTGDRHSACRVACESGEPVILRDLSIRSDLAPWTDAALEQGYRSMIALPLQADGAPFGNLSIFANTPDAFDGPEVALLAELADDLAFGIGTLRTRAVQAQEVRQLRNDAERDTRASIAATLHDGVGQTLQALNFGLKHLRAMAQGRETVSVELLDRLIAEAGDALRDIRAVSSELRPLFLERVSLLDAVRLHCSETARRTGSAIRIFSDKASFALEDGVKEQCFLAFREALSNALCHAGASRIHVALRVRPQDRLTLTIIDDGVGFDTQRIFERPAGLGLGMIHERAEGVLGRACIRSIPGKGTVVRICVPLTSEPVLCP